MKVAFGMKAHSGWAALVVIGRLDGSFVVVDRQRLGLADELWAKAPYHAAENLEPTAARDLVKRGIESAHRIAGREMRAALKREQGRENEVSACAVLVANPMPAWSVDEILAVHFRMHKAEGVLFREVLLEASQACGLRTAPIAEKSLTQHAQNVLQASPADLAAKIATLGKLAGPPWAKDQKDAALAAMAALAAITP